MKKIFSLMLCALTLVGLTSCPKPEPDPEPKDESTLKIEVKEVHAEYIVVAVTPQKAKAGATYLCSYMSESEFNQTYLGKDDEATIKSMVENMQAMADNNNENFADYLDVDDIEVTIPCLRPSTKYVFVGAFVTKEGKATNNKLFKATFTTEALTPSANDFLIDAENGNLTVEPSNSDTYYVTVAPTDLVTQMGFTSVEVYAYQEYFIYVNMGHGILLENNILHNSTYTLSWTDIIKAWGPYLSAANTEATDNLEMTAIVFGATEYGGVTTEAAKLVFTGKYPIDL